MTFHIENLGLILTAIGILIPLGISVVKVFSHISKLNGRIDILENDLRHHREALDLQRSELSELSRFFRELGFELFRQQARGGNS